MLIKSRITVVDDKDHHLSGIKSCLNELRLDCHSKLYKEEDFENWQALPGTRLLFLDQYLTTEADFGTPNRLAFAKLTEVVKKLICPESGPYGLVLWSEQPDLEDLKRHLFQYFRDEDSRLLPVFFSVFQKHHYINTLNGSVVNAERLKQDIGNLITSSPQLHALLAWEADVSVAVDAVLRSIVDLVPKDLRASNEFAEEIGRILYRFAQAGAGIKRATENPRDAINRVLVPILADRTTRHDPDSESAVDWNTALIGQADGAPPPTVSAQASVNGAIHLSLPNLPGGAQIASTELGAVIESLPGNLEDSLMTYFGLSEQELREIFGINEMEWNDCKLRLVQIGASCDNAQPKPGPLLYLLAVEWLFANADGSKDRNKPKLNKKRKVDLGAAWSTPILLFPTAENPGRLTVFLNLTVSVPKDETEDWTVTYRLREELISNITQEYARFISRPGIVTLPS